MAFDRLIQLTLRARNFLSKDVEPASDSMRELAEEGRRLKTSLEEAGRARGLARTLRDNQQATEGLERTQRDARATLDDLTREIGDHAQATAGQRIALREARRTLDEAERAYKRNQQAIKNTTSELKKLGVDTDNAAAEEQRLTNELAEGKQALAGNREAIKQKRIEEKKAADTTKQHADRVDAARSVLSDGAKRVLAFAAAYISLNAAFNLVRGGLNLLRDGIRAVIADGSSNEQALAQLESALASTGNAAGLTAQQLLDMADEFRDASMLTTEQILAGQTRLLSYTDIVASEFPAAMQIVIDQQQRLGISVEQSAEIVGRALQSPSEAIATLGRQGFKFEAGQKALLKQLEATGRKAEAQAIIMDMLTEAYGGAAAAAKMNTFAGLLKTVGDQFGDFAGRVANSGAFDFVKGKLAELASNLDTMANDGRLDRLAQALSDAFVNAGEAVSKYAEKLATVDFEGLAERASSAAAKIGPAIEETVGAGQYVIAALTTAWNMFAGTVNAAGSALVLAVQQTVGRVLLAGGQIAEMFGRGDLRTEADEFYRFLGELSSSYADQALADLGQIPGAWDFLNDSVKEKAAEQTAAVKQEADDQFEHIVQRVTDMNNALAQIDAAEGAAQLKQLGEEMYKAYQRGDLSQQQYASGTAMLQAKLRDVGGAAAGMGAAVGIAADNLKSLADVQRAIGDAKTDRDITAITTALRRLYDNGQIGAAEYNAELAKLSARQKELKQALEGSKKAQDEKNKSDREAIVTSEELRRESGKRMEAERRAGDQAMQDRRRGSEEAQRDMGAMEDFFGGVMTRAREPLAAMSDAALEAFDRLNGLSTANIEMDTSSLDATTSSLRRATEALGEMQAAANTVGMSTLGRWMTQTQLQSQQLQIQFLGQKARLQSLMEGYEDGSITVQQFVRRASSARHAMSLLNDSDLRTLESAIQAAKDRMEQMANSTRSTLEGLQDELDNLQGRTEDIERRRFASRRRELEAQMAEANAQGDSQAVANAARALGMLRQIESETAQQRQREEQQKRIDAQQQPQGAAPQPAQAPGKVIRLEVPGRQAVDVAVRSEADETKLLGVLESAGLRAL
ncbi:phage tail length tape measure family protein [Stutzerimonas nitrititolerans]|uniref:phage tail length tape measure family protein n=1 Tax=Stutzerimonas nitrititolerans TaxID=2482751 RepID=UPI0028A7A0E9|nr:phage tail length tape measure family protein [Stutzerimonas nitrititolerans]